jgi:hypothetical protein
MAFTGSFPAAAAARAPFGLSSATATVIEHLPGDSHWISGYDQELDLCGASFETWALCGSTPAAVQPPQPAGPRFVRVNPFSLVAADLCDTPLAPSHRLDREKRLLNLLDLGTFRGVERELWTGESTIASQATPAKRNRYLKSGAVSVGAATSPRIALAQLEDAYSSCGNGERPTIHMTPGTATLLSEQLFRDGSRLVTAAGSIVVAGSGYPSDTATTATMFATGPVMVHLGKSEMLSDNIADYFTPSSNKLVLRAERPVAVTWDGCCHFSATVNYS